MEKTTSREIERRLLDQRIEALERETRNLKLFGFFAVLLFGALAVVVAYEMRPKMLIMAEEFRLVGSDGRTRAWMTIDSNGPELRMFDENQRPRITLRVTDGSGGSLVLRDEAQRDRLALKVDHEGPTVSLNDQDSRPRAMFRFNLNRPALTFLDEANRKRSEMFLDRDGPGIVLHAENGKATLSLFQLQGERIRGPVMLMQDDVSGAVLYSAPR